MTSSTLGPSDTSVLGMFEDGCFLCSSCIESSASPTTWYFAQLIGGHRTTFCRPGMLPNDSSRGVLASDVLPSWSIASLSSSLGSFVVTSWFPSVNSRGTPEEDVIPPLASAAAKALGSEIAIFLCRSSCIRWLEACFRWSCRMPRVARNAMASGLSLSDIGIGGGGFDSSCHSICVKSLWRPARCENDTGGVSGDHAGAVGVGGRSIDES